MAEKKTKKRFDFSAVAKEPEEVVSEEVVSEEVVSEEVVSEEVVSEEVLQKTTEEITLKEVMQSPTESKESDLPPIPPIPLMQGLSRSKEEKRIDGCRWVPLNGRLGFLSQMKYTQARNLIALHQNPEGEVFFAVHTSLPRFPSPIPQVRGFAVDKILESL